MAKGTDPKQPDPNKASEPTEHDTPESKEEISAADTLYSDSLPSGFDSDKTEVTPSSEEEDHTAQLPGSTPPVPPGEHTLVDQSTDSPPEPSSTLVTPSQNDAQTSIIDPTYDQTLVTPDDVSVTERLPSTPETNEPLLDQTLQDPVDSGAVSELLTDAGTAAGISDPSQGHTSPLTPSELREVEGGRGTHQRAQKQTQKIHPPAHAPTRPAAPRLHSHFPGVPGYEILDELGRGGMGVVYKARQIRLNRLVALKMIRAGGSARTEDYIRFRKEAEAVAQFQHPNIVQIYEIGDVGGLPYFSLELVEGGSLHEEMHKETGIPMKRAAAIVETLARAMDYAHERNIIHRDLKPANILLHKTEGAEDGSRSGSANRTLQHSGSSTHRQMHFHIDIPKITDFGLAKHLEDDQSQTRDGAILGTPSYMAPEQAAGRGKEVGPAADIYALGAILYDMLVARPPFRGETLMDTIQLVIHEEPVAPRHLRKNLDQDLETICLKCLQKDPKKRYETALELAEDLSRYLNDEPILARTTPLWEKTWKWAKRRPAVATSIGLILVLIGAVIGGSLWYGAEQGERARVEAGLRDKADQLAKSESEQRAKANRLAKSESELRQIAEAKEKRARKNFRVALQSVDQMMGRLSDQLANQPGQERFRRALLFRALFFYQGFLAEKPQDEDVKADTAFAHRHIGEIQEKLGQYKDAEASYLQAKKYFEDLHAKHPEELEYRRGLASTLNQLGTVLHKTERVEEAEKLFDESISLLNGNELIDSSASDPISYLADSHMNRAILRLKTARPSLALKDYQQSLGILERMHQRHPRSTRIQAKLALNRLGLGALHFQDKKSDKALEEFTKAIELWMPLVEKEKDNPDHRMRMAQACRNRGIVYFTAPPQGLEQKKALENAEGDFHKAANALDGLVKEFSDVAEYRTELVEAQKALGNLYAFMREYRKEIEAREETEKQLSELIRRFPKDEQYPLELARVQSAHGNALYQSSKPEEAAEMFQKATETYAKLLETQPKEEGIWRERIANHGYIKRMWQQLSNTVSAASASEKLIQAQKDQIKALGEKAELLHQLSQWEYDHAKIVASRNQPEKAKEAIGDAIGHMENAIAKKGKEPMYHQFYCKLLLEGGQYEKVDRCLQQWLKSAPQDKLDHRLMAARAVQAATLAQSRQSPENWKEVVTKCSDQAMALLNQASKNKKLAAEFLLGDLFKILKDRKDFQELVKKLQAGSTGG